MLIHGGKGNHRILQRPFILPKKAGRCLSQSHPLWQGGRHFAFFGYNLHDGCPKSMPEAKRLGLVTSVGDEKKRERASEGEGNQDLLDGDAFTYTPLHCRTIWDLLSTAGLPCPRPVTHPQSPSEYQVVAWPYCTGGNQN